MGVTCPPQSNGQGGHGRNGHGGYMGNVHWTMDMVNWFSIPLLPHSTGPQINWSPCQCWESCKLEKIASQVFRRKIWDSSDSLFIFIIPPCLPQNTLNPNELHISNILKYFQCLFSFFSSLFHC